MEREPYLLFESINPFFDLVPGIIDGEYQRVPVYAQFVIGDSFLYPRVLHIGAF